jgi:hypothetical protein
VNKVAVSLEPRAPHEAPLTPTCVVGIGAVGAALCARLLEDPHAGSSSPRAAQPEAPPARAAPADDPLAHLDGLRVLDPPLVLVRGPAAHLPWVDGALYLGEIAPGLHVPTTTTLNVPPALVRDAFARQVPLALIPVPSAAAPARVVRVSLRAVLPVARELLALVANDARAAAASRSAPPRTP